MLMDMARRAEKIGISAEKCHFFDHKGYLKVDGVLTGGALSRVQSEFRRVKEATRDDWQKTVAARPDFRPYRLCETSHVVFPVTPHGDVFIDLMAHPQTLAIAEAFMGPDMVMGDNALHVKPAGTLSHVGWHRDSPSWNFQERDAWHDRDKLAWEKMKLCEIPFLKIKIFFFIHDVDETTSPFSMISGSHKWPTKKIPAHKEIADMPDHVKLVGKAGDALLWNGCILHAAMHNTDTKARRMLFYNYIHFGMKQHDPCIPKGAFAESLKNRSPICRQLFGFERMKRT